MGREEDLFLIAGRGIGNGEEKSQWENVEFYLIYVTR